MKTGDEFLSDGAKTYAERSKTYGNNYLVIGKMLAATFPDGLTINSADDWNRLVNFIQIMNKLSRYANLFLQGGHADSMHDLMVYGAMQSSIDDEILSRGASDD